MVEIKRWKQLFLQAAMANTYPAESQLNRFVIATKKIIIPSSKLNGIDTIKPKAIDNPDKSKPITIAIDQVFFAS